MCTLSCNMANNFQSNTFFKYFSFNVTWSAVHYDYDRLQFEKKNPLYTNTIGDIVESAGMNHMLSGNVEVAVKR